MVFFGGKAKKMTIGRAFMAALTVFFPSLCKKAGYKDGLWFVAAVLSGFVWTFWLMRSYVKFQESGFLKTNLILHRKNKFFHLMSTKIFIRKNLSRSSPLKKKERFLDLGFGDGKTGKRLLDLGFEIGGGWHDAKRFELRGKILFQKGTEWAFTISGQ